MIAMNEPEMDSTPSAELTDQITALRRQVITLLLALIVVSGTLAVFLWYQSRITGKEIDAQKEKIKVASHSGSSSKSGKSTTASSTISGREHLKGFTDEELDEMFGEEE